MSRPLEGKLRSGLKRVGLRLEMASVVAIQWPQEGGAQASGRHGKGRGSSRRCGGALSDAGTLLECSPEAREREMCLFIEWLSHQALAAETLF